MATDAANHLIRFLLVRTANREDLGVIRHWTNLKIGVTQEGIWVKDFTEAQINSVEIRSLPQKEIFYLQDGKLYRQNSLLPDRNVPGALWSPIARGLPVQLPDFNHHFFGLDEKVEIKLIPATTEQEAIALMVCLADLQNYLESAPAVRLQKLNWIMLPPGKAFLMGTPLLPVSGETFWQLNNFLLPTGFTFNFPILADSLAGIMSSSAEPESWILWNEANARLMVPKKQFKSLSISSLRLSILQNASLPTN